ncbi:MAG TPA: zinc-binding dehydrogenase [Amycolatopsis sp.]|nr:zinc-binding dehydrogenase [Amycolatopsis sp.]
MTISGRRMVFVRAGRPLECRRWDVGPPAAGGAVVRVTHAGVCGSDVHRLDGEQTDMGYPVAFGHEGVGVVEALGEGVRVDTDGVPLRAGDAVYWANRGPVSESLGVTWPPPADVPSQAAYQDYATLTADNAIYRIPEGTDPEAVIAFGCAMPTALGGMARLGPIRPGQSVVVQGCGPVGLAATMLAGLSMARQVIVIGAPETRLARAETLGATATIALETTSAAERAEAVRELTGGRGADVVVEATGNPAAFEEGFGLLAESGRYLILGLYAGSGTVALDPFRLNNRSLSVIGSLGPTHHCDYRTTIQLAGRHGERLSIAGLITHRFPLGRTEEAIDTMRRGEAVKAVVLPTMEEAAT